MLQRRFGVKIEDICITSDLKHFERNVRELILSSLKPWDSKIDIIAMKVRNAFIAPQKPNGFQCTILLRAMDGQTFRSDSRDSDEMLAIYKALSKIIDEFLPKIMVDNGEPQLIDKINNDNNDLDNAISNNI